MVYLLLVGFRASISRMTPTSSRRGRCSNRRRKQTFSWRHGPCGFSGLLPD